MANPTALRSGRRAILLVLLLVYAFICLFPFYWMTVMATVEENRIFSEMPLTPGSHLLDNYKVLVQGIPFWRAMFNSIYVGALMTALTVLVCSLAGYAFAKFRFKGRRVLLWIALSTMMIPPQLGLVAFVWQMNLMAWANTHLPLIIPPVASGFGVFWMRQYMLTSLPSEMMESARMDGCGEFRIFFSIVAPVITPAFLTLGILSFMNSWQNFILPLVTISSFEKFTLPLAINALKGVYRNNYSAQFLGIALSTLPVVLVFLSGTKKFISGLTAGAVKG